MKLFIASKLYDTTAKTIAEIEKEVQKDLDYYVGKDKVIFKLCITGKTASMSFFRGVDYFSLYADPKSMIVDADAYMVTGEGVGGFRMPCQFPKVPFGYSYSMEQIEFLNAYQESAEILGADKIKNAELNIEENKIVLIVKM